jgi:hypothetical protein
MITGLNRYSYIVLGILVAVVLILPPFPALL